MHYNDLDELISALVYRFKSSVSSGVSDSQDGITPTASQEPMTPAPPQQMHHQFLGDATAAVPQFANIDLGDESLPDGVTLEDLHLFSQLYKEHCKVRLSYKNSCFAL